MTENKTWQNRAIRINDDGSETVIIWSAISEVNYVNGLGTGKWSEGSDLKHKREWWLRQYLKATENINGDHVAAGRLKAQELLAKEKSGWKRP